MINTKPTLKHIKNIKQHKNFLEQWDMWDFAYFDGKEYYFLTLYKRFDRITGYVILNSNGEIVPFNQAKDPFKYLTNYNTIVCQAISVILPQMKKNVSPVKEIFQLLNKNREAMNNFFLPNSVVIDRIIAGINQTLEIADQLLDLHYNMAEYQRHIMQERGYLDLEFLRLIQSEYDRFEEIMYQYEIQEKSLTKDYESVLEILNNNEVPIPKWDLMKIKKLLKSATSLNKDNLEKSMKHYGKYNTGDKTFSDKNRMKESLKEINDLIYFEENMVTILRN